jgi:hypothetical protein
MQVIAAHTTGNATGNTEGQYIVPSALVSIKRPSLILRLFVLRQQVAHGSCSRRRSWDGWRTCGRYDRHGWCWLKSQRNGLRLTVCHGTHRCHGRRRGRCCNCRGVGRRSCFGRVLPWWERSKSMRRRRISIARIHVIAACIPSQYEQKPETNAYFYRVE